MTAICAASTLAVLMLIINIGYLLNCLVNELCHSCCAVYCLAFVRWGSTMVDILVDWHPPTLGTCFDGSFLALAMVNLIVFEHVEMY